MYTYQLGMHHFCEEKWLIEQIHSFAVKLFDDRIILFFESCSIETIKNAVGCFLTMKIFEWKYLETMTQGVKDEVMITLSEKYQDIESLNNVLK